MSFLHLIYIGHFYHERDLVQFSSTLTDPIMKPVVRRPLDMGEVKRLVQEVSGLEEDPLFPADWNIWVEDGYLAGNRYALNQEAIDFIARMIRLAGCDIVDFNARSNWNSPRKVDRELRFIRSSRPTSRVSTLR